MITKNTSTSWKMQYGADGRWAYQSVVEKTPAGESEKDDDAANYPPEAGDEYPVASHDTQALAEEQDPEQPLVNHNTTTLHRQVRPRSGLRSAAPVIEAKAPEPVVEKIATQPIVVYKHRSRSRAKPKAQEATDALVVAPESQSVVENTISLLGEPAAITLKAEKPMADKGVVEPIAEDDVDRILSAIIAPPDAPELTGDKSMAQSATPVVNDSTDLLMTSAAVAPITPAPLDDKAMDQPKTKVIKPKPESKPESKPKPESESGLLMTSPMIESVALTSLDDALDQPEAKPRHKYEYKSRSKSKANAQARAQAKVEEKALLLDVALIKNHGVLPPFSDRELILKAGLEQAIDDTLSILLAADQKITPEARPSIVEKAIDQQLVSSLISADLPPVAPAIRTKIQESIAEKSVEKPQVKPMDKTSARLLSAAPDLISACQALLRCIDPDRDWAEEKQAKAAIAKALGVAVVAKAPAAKAKKAPMKGLPLNYEEWVAINEDELAGQIAKSRSDKRPSFNRDVFNEKAYKKYLARVDN